MAINNVTNKFALDRYVVDPIPGNGGYTTIQAAINDAQANGVGTVWINAGTYNESLTISGSSSSNGNLDIIAATAPGSLGVYINGNATISGWNDSINFQNVNFSAGTGDAVTISSTAGNSTSCNFTFCNMYAGSGNAITASSATNFTLNLNNCFLQADLIAIAHAGPNGSANAYNCTISSTNGTTALDITGILFNSYNCQISAANNGVVLEDSGATVQFLGGLLSSGAEFVNIVSGGLCYLFDCVVYSFAGSLNIATGTGNLQYSEVSVGGTATQLDPALTLLNVPILPPSTTPIDSDGASLGFGFSLTPGTALQNTLGYDILVNLSFNISSSTSGQLTMGVGPTNPPIQTGFTDPLGITFATPTVISCSALVPNNYWLIADGAGTISITSITLQTCPI